MKWLIAASVLVGWAVLAGCGESHHRQPTSNKSATTDSISKQQPQYSRWSPGWRLMPPDSLRAKSKLARLYMMESDGLAYSLYTKGDWLFNAQNTLVVNNTAYFFDAQPCNPFICQELLLNEKKVGHYQPIESVRLNRWCILILDDLGFLAQTDTWHDADADAHSLRLELLSLRDSVFTDSVANAVRHYPPDFYHTPAILLRKGDFLNQLGFYREAVLFYDTVIAHFPKDPAAYLARAELCYDYLNRRPQARRDYRTYLDLMRQQGRDVTDAHITQRL